jgi:thymidine kinase
MAKLYFYYASMNAGKSTTLLQANFNYHERGMTTMLWTADLDNRGGEKAIESRIGLHAQAHRFAGDTDLFERVSAAHKVEPLACVMVDEAQFLTEVQVWCYGLRTDFQGELFPGAKLLLGIADSLIELKAVCHCGRKSSMNLRVDASGAAVRQGAQTEIGGNDRYVALCRKHFAEALGWWE